MEIANTPPPQEQQQQQQQRASTQTLGQSSQPPYPPYPPQHLTGPPMRFAPNQGPVPPMFPGMFPPRPGFMWDPRLGQPPMLQQQQQHQQQQQQQQSPPARPVINDLRFSHDGGLTYHTHTPHPGAQRAPRSVALRPWEIGKK